MEPRTAGRSRPLVVIVVFGVVVVVGWLTAAPKGPAATPLFYPLYFVTWALACVMAWIAAFRGSREAARPWRWIAAALTVAVLPQPFSLVTAALHDGRPADLAILAVLWGKVLWGALMVVATLKFPMTPLTGPQRNRLSADVITVVGGGFLVVWYFQIGPALLRGDVGSDTLTIIGYPIIDLAFIFGMSVLALRNGIPARGGPLPVLLAGVICQLIFDFTTGQASLRGPIVWSGPMAIGTFIATVLIAAAAAIHVAQSKGDTAGVQHETPSKVAHLPYIALFAGFAMMVKAVVEHGSLLWCGVVAGVIVMTSAVVARQVMAIRENQGLVLRDSLTGLASRLSTEAALQTAVRRQRHGGAASAVLLIDLDGFKAVNDTLGHDAGDAMLITFADVLRGTLGGADVAGRVGGDEFVVVLDGPSNSEEALAVARRVLANAVQRSSAGRPDLVIRASIGVAMTDAAHDAATVRHRADVAMYAAKRTGRHGVELWHPGLRDDRPTPPDLDVDAAPSVDRGQLRAFLRGIVSWETGEIVAAEVSARWDHPVHGLIRADQFTPAAERTGTIEAIDRWVLDAAATQARTWRQKTGRRLAVSVTVSPRQLRQPDLVQRIQAALGRDGLEPGDLILELTGSAVVFDAESQRPVHRLRALGVRIAVDDLGTVCSSLHRLPRLPVDILKIDRPIADVRGSKVTEAVIRLAQAMNLDTIVAGVEIPAHASDLTALEHRTGQCRPDPVPANEFEELLVAADSHRPQRSPTG